MRAPDIVVGNQDFRSVTSIMAFKNVIRVRAGLSGMSDCILHLPQVYLRDLKNSYVGKKFEHRSDLVPSTRKDTSCMAGQGHRFRPKYTAISPKYTVISIKIHSGDSGVLCRL